MNKIYKSLLVNLYLDRAQSRNLKLCVMSLSKSKPKDLDEAFEDNLKSDIGCVERILA